MRGHKNRNGRELANSRPLTIRSPTGANRRSICASLFPVAPKERFRVIIQRREGPAKGSPFFRAHSVRPDGHPAGKAVRHERPTADIPATQNPRAMDPLLHDALRPPRPHPESSRTRPSSIERLGRETALPAGSPPTTISATTPTAPSRPSRRSTTPQAEQRGWLRRDIPTPDHATAPDDSASPVPSAHRPARRHRRDLRPGAARMTAETAGRTDQARTVPLDLPSPSGPLAPGNGHRCPQKLGTDGPQNLGTAHL